MSSVNAIIGAVNRAIDREVRAARMFRLRTCSGVWRQIREVRLRGLHASGGESR